MEEIYERYGSISASPYAISFIRRNDTPLMTRAYEQLKALNIPTSLPAEPLQVEIATKFQEASIPSCFAPSASPEYKLTDLLIDGEALPADLAQAPDEEDAI
jgi:hypothetical protein